MKARKQNGNSKPEETWQDRDNRHAEELLALIAYKLKFSADNVKDESLWEVANSVKYYLAQHRAEHSTVKRLNDADQKLRAYCYGDKSHVIKKSHHTKIQEAAEAITFATADIFLYTGFLMGIKALKETLDTEKAKTAFRLTRRERKPVSQEDLRESQLYWALRN